MKWDPLSAINICGPFYKIHTFYMQPHHHQSCYQPGGGGILGSWIHVPLYLLFRLEICSNCGFSHLLAVLGGYLCTYYSWASVNTMTARGMGAFSGDKSLHFWISVLRIFQSLRVKENVLDIVCTYKLTTRAHRGAFLTRSTLRSVVVVNKNLTCT